MELAMGHDPWRQGGYNAGSDFSAPWSDLETQVKRCYKFQSRDKSMMVPWWRHAVMRWNERLRKIGDGSDNAMCFSRSLG
jgi:hypothetical protein